MQTVMTAREYAMQRELSAYKAAFNQIDEIIETGSLTRAQFMTIADDLTDMVAPHKVAA